jgi:hypothetical protein
MGLEDLVMVWGRMCVRVGYGIGEHRVLEAARYLQHRLWLVRAAARWELQLTLEVLNSHCPKSQVCNGYASNGYYYSYDIEGNRHLRVLGNCVRVSGRILRQVSYGRKRSNGTYFSDFFAVSIKHYSVTTERFIAIATQQAQSVVAPIAVLVKATRFLRKRRFLTSEGHNFAGKI